MRTPEFEVVADAAKAVHYGLHDVAERIARVIEADAWQRFVLPNGRIVEHDTFAAFVADKPPRGLGSDMDTVRRVCRDTAYALDLVDRAVASGSTARLGV